MNYKTKQRSIQAIKFVYTEERINSLKELFGNDIIAFEKERRLDAFGVAVFNQKNNQQTRSRYVSEGMWLIKDESGNTDFEINDEEFLKKYELPDSEIEFLKNEIIELQDKIEDMSYFADQH